jgi:hypothetical protein
MFFWPALRAQGNYYLIDHKYEAFRHKPEELAEIVLGTVPICKPALLASDPHALAQE